MATHVPERTCVGCRTRAQKPALVRLVRGPEGTVRVDRDGRAAGRGAYVHRSDGCIEHALRRGAIARALRTSVGEDEARKLRMSIGEVRRNA